MQAEVTIYSRDRCNQRHILDHRVTETMICAGKLAGGVDSCQVGRNCLFPIFLFFAFTSSSSYVSFFFPPSFPPSLVPSSAPPSAPPTSSPFLLLFLLSFFSSYFFLLLLFLPLLLLFLLLPPPPFSSSPSSLPTYFSSIFPFFPSPSLPLSYLLSCLYLFFHLSFEAHFLSLSL